MTDHGPQDGLCPWHAVVTKSFLSIFKNINRKYKAQQLEMLQGRL